MDALDALSDLAAAAAAQAETETDTATTTTARATAVINEDGNMQSEHLQNDAAGHTHDGHASEEQDELMDDGDEPGKALENEAQAQELGAIADDDSQRPENERGRRDSKQDTADDAGNSQQQQQHKQQHQHQDEIISPATRTDKRRRSSGPPSCSIANKKKKEEEDASPGMPGSHSPPASQPPSGTADGTHVTGTVGEQDSLKRSYDQVDALLQAAASPSISHPYTHPQHQQAQAHPYPPPPLAHGAHAYPHPHSRPHPNPHSHAHAQPLPYQHYNPYSAHPSSSSSIPPYPPLKFPKPNPSSSASPFSRDREREREREAAYATSAGSYPPQPPYGSAAQPYPYPHPHPHPAHARQPYASMSNGTTGPPQRGSATVNGVSSKATNGGPKTSNNKNSSNTNAAAKEPLEASGSGSGSASGSVSGSASTSGSGTTSTSTTKKSSYQGPKISMACFSCRSSKTRCSGTQPCTRCGMKRIECGYPLRDGRTAGRNSTTSTQLPSHATQINGNDPAISATSPPTASAQNTARQGVKVEEPTQSLLGTSNGPSSGHVGPSSAAGPTSPPTITNGRLSQSHPSASQHARRLSTSSNTAAGHAQDPALPPLPPAYGTEIRTTKTSPGALSGPAVTAATASEPGSTCSRTHMSRPLSETLKQRTDASPDGPAVLSEKSADGSTSTSRPINVELEKPVEHHFKPWNALQLHDAGSLSSRGSMMNGAALSSQLPSPDAGSRPVSTYTSTRNSPVSTTANPERIAKAEPVDPDRLLSRTAAASAPLRYDPHASSGMNGLSPAEKSHRPSVSTVSSQPPTPRAWSPKDGQIDPELLSATSVNAELLPGVANGTLDGRATPPSSVASTAATSLSTHNAAGALPELPGASGAFESAFGNMGAFQGQARTKRSMSDLALSEAAYYPKFGMDGNSSAGRLLLRNRAGGPLLGGGAGASVNGIKTALPETLAPWKILLVEAGIPDVETLKSEIPFEAVKRYVDCLAESWPDVLPNFTKRFQLRYAIEDALLRG